MELKTPKQPATKLKTLRVFAGISQREMANYLKMDQPNYCNAENGRVNEKRLAELTERAMPLLRPMCTGKVKAINEAVWLIEHLIKKP